MSAFPEFFDAAPVLQLHDALAEFLGAAQGGVMEYRYADVVRFAGHSCPTVACAFLATRAALKALYPETVPERGEVLVSLREAENDGTTGVVGAVAGLITGAAGAGGFGGIGGHFVRRRRLRYAQPQPSLLRYERADGGGFVDVEIHPDRIPVDPELRGLLSCCLSGSADASVQGVFAAAWQARVKALLLDHADDPLIFELHPHIAAQGAVHRPRLGMVS